MNKFLLLVAALMVTTSLSAQYVEPERKAKPLHPLDSLGYKVEMQGCFSHGKTPLWMNANGVAIKSG